MVGDAHGVTDCCLECCRRLLQRCIIPAVGHRVSAAGPVTILDGTRIALQRSWSLKSLYVHHVVCMQGLPHQPKLFIQVLCLQQLHKLLLSLLEPVQVTCIDVAAAYDFSGGSHVTECPVSV